MGTKLFCGDYSVRCTDDWWSGFFLCKGEKRFEKDNAPATNVNIHDWPFMEFKTSQNINNDLAKSSPLSKKSLDGSSLSLLPLLLSPPLYFFCMSHTHFFTKWGGCNPLSLHWRSSGSAWIQLKRRVCSNFHDHDAVCILIVSSFVCILVLILQCLCPVFYFV